MALAVTLPASLLAAGLLARKMRSEAQSRLTIGLLAAWSLTGGVGVAAWHWLHLVTPPYRWAGFALAIPLLIAAAPLKVGRALPGRRWSIVALAVAAVPAVLLAARGAEVWWSLPPRQPPALYRELSTVAAYSQVLEPNQRIVLPKTRRIRAEVVLAGLPPALYSRVVLDPPVWSAGADGDPSARTTDAVLLLRSLNRRRETTGAFLTPGVTLLRGPLPATPLEPARPFPDAKGTILMTFAALASLTVVGGGWSAALGGTSPMGALALSPSFGIAVLGIGGTMAARLGIRPSGIGAIAILATLAVLGILVAHLRGRSESPAPR
jgi:hypothetical protein